MKMANLIGMKLCSNKLSTLAKAFSENIGELKRL
jgi:hypothetical protein